MKGCYKKRPFKSFYMEKVKVKVNEGCGDKFPASHINDGTELNLPRRTALELVKLGLVTLIEVLANKSEEKKQKKKKKGE